MSSALPYPDVIVVNTPLILAENSQDTIVNPLMIEDILGALGVEWYCLLLNKFRKH